MTTTEQRAAAMVLANRKRALMQEVRRDLRTGGMTLTDAMLSPPEALNTVPLIDIIRWTRCQGRPRKPAVVAIGKRALRDQVNLMVPLGEASLRSRAWVAEHGTYHLRLAA